MRITWLVPLAVAIACDSTAPPPAPDRVLDVSFAEGAQGWQAAIADHAPADAEAIGFEAAHRQASGPMPAGFHVAGTAPSGGLFMFIRSRVTGLRPDAPYRMEFEVDFATRTPADCSGTEGVPGEPVWLKVGGTPLEPRPAAAPVPPDALIRTTIDKGDPGEDGRDAIVIGNAGDQIGCQEGWRRRRLRSTRLFGAVADSTGSLWVLAGTESMSEGRTELVYTRIQARFWEIDLAARLP